MPNWEVNLSIQSYVGFKRPDGAADGGVSAPRPVLQTVETLDGATFPVTGVTANSKMLYVPPLETFTYAPYQISDAQVVTVKNSGTQAVVLLATTSTNYQTTAIFDSIALPAVVPVGGSYSFNVRYYAETSGEYAESLLLISTADVAYYRIDTLQDVVPAFAVRVSSTSTVITTTVLGEAYQKTITLTPIVNGVDDAETILGFTTSLVGSIGWTATVGVNTIELRWDPDRVDNINNTTTGYSSTLTVNVNGSTDIIVVNNTAYVDIDYTKYKNLSVWMSPAASYNSIIGISFDIFNGIKTLTIGVGAGGDGTPVYADGGGAFTVLRNLAIGAGTTDIIYPYWSTVYNIPLPTAGTYLSGVLGGDGAPLYMKKTTDGLNYADYFGYEQGVGSMFVIEYDGYSNVNIDINNLRELSGDPEFDATMENLTRAFHYYSAVDVSARYYQLAVPTPGDLRTPLFRGFVATAITPVEVWTIDTSLVPLPT